MGRDLAEALRWYKKAVRRGEAAAASNIGTIYRDDGKVPLARRWFKKGLVMGDGDAALELAQTYLQAAKFRSISIKNAKKFLKFAVSSKSIIEENREAAVALLAQLSS